MEPVFNLTTEELESEAELASTEYASVPILEDEKERLQSIAQNTLAKNKMITIRLSERDLMRVKAASAREGLPYQTFIASLIHKNI